VSHPQCCRQLANLMCDQCPEEGKNLHVVGIDGALYVLRLCDDHSTEQTARLNGMGVDEFREFECGNA